MIFLGRRFDDFSGLEVSGFDNFSGSEVCLFFWVGFFIWI